MVSEANAGELHVACNLELVDNAEGHSMVVIKQVMSIHRHFKFVIVTGNWHLEDRTLQNVSMYIKPSRIYIDTTYIKEHPRSEGVVDLPFLFAPDASNSAVSHQDVIPYPGVDMQGYAVGRTLHKVDGKPAAQICKCNVFSSQTLRGRVITTVTHLSAFLRALPLKIKVLPGNIFPGIKVL